MTVFPPISQLVMDRNKTIYLLKLNNNLDADNVYLFFPLTYQFQTEPELLIVGERRTSVCELVIWLGIPRFMRVIPNQIACMLDDCLFENKFYVFRSSW